MDIEKIKLKYKYLIINFETDDYDIVKSTRLLSDLLKNKYDIIISHMFFYRYFNDKKNYVIKEKIIIKKLYW